MERVAAEGWSHVVLDGTVVESDRCAAQTTSSKGEQIDLWYSWLRGERLDGGCVRTACRSRSAMVGPRPHRRRENVLAALSAGLPTLADGGYDGAGQGVHPGQTTPGGTPRAINNRAYDTLLRSLRCRGEGGFALTRRWRVLQHVTARPHKIGDIAQAALVLTHFEHKYLTC